MSIVGLKGSTNINVINSKHNKFAWEKAQSTRKCIMTVDTGQWKKQETMALDIFQGVD